MRRPGVPVANQQHGRQQEDQRPERKNAVEGYSNVSPYVPPIFGSRH